jgi:hypothetical protein
MYEHYLKHGRDAHIQEVYVIFLDEWMRVNQIEGWDAGMPLKRP